MYRWTSHTGEEQLEIEAPTPAAVLAEAVEAFGRAIELDPSAGDPAKHEVRVAGPDLETLLVDLLQELVFLAETDGFVPDGAELELVDSTVEGTVRGRRTQVRQLVKAATYAGLRFERDGATWRARVVLDV
jgi:SHS2 domain-containing protein